MYKKIVEMYAEGYELIEIQEECNLTNEKEVIENINVFKELSKIVRGTKRFSFNTNFKDVVVGRFLSGELSIYKISNELALSTSTVSKYLQEAGVCTKQPFKKNYAVIEDWDDFECCPTCNRERTVRQLGLHCQDESNKEKLTHAFCSACNTEWFLEDGEVRKVLWHNVK